MSDTYVQALQVEAIAQGGMLAVALDGREIVICRTEGAFYAVARRCGHMNAPLEMGTLEGSLLTCPLHCAQFDVTTGAALAGPVPCYLGKEPPPARIQARLKNEALLQEQIRTESIATYPVKVEDGWVWVAL